MWLCCAADRPREVKAKGMTGAKHNKMLEMADNPEAFKVPLDKACCAEPLCCVVGTACAFLPFPGFYLRSKVLTTYGNGIADFLCCQGYFDPLFRACPCCCCAPGDCCPGTTCGLWLEACLCPVTSVSISRIYVMEAKRLHPDPVDYQIIHCSNRLQMASCICHVLAIFRPEFRDAAEILDCIADTFTAMVNGCMCAQIVHEIKPLKHGRIVPAVAGGTHMTSAPQPQVMAHHPQPAFPQPAVHSQPAQKAHAGNGRELAYLVNPQADTAQTLETDVDKHPAQHKADRLQKRLSDKRKPLPAALPRVSPPIAAYLKTAFSEYDADHNNFLDYHEFWYLVSALAFDLDKDAIDALWHRCDKNGDQKISLAELAPVLGPKIMEVYGNKPPAPEDWCFLQNEEGYPYWYNKRTGVSQWADPAG